MENSIDGRTEAEIVKDGIEKGQTHVTIITGDAPEPLKTYNPKAIDLKGTIDAPSRFAEVRDFERQKSHALVSVSRGEIKLVVNEQNTDDTHTVTGRVIIAKVFAELGINTSKTYRPEGLAKHLKLKRNLFESPTEHTALIGKLRNIKAKVNANIEKAKDDKGNVTDVFNKTVETDMPEKFTLVIPLIEGQKPVKIEVFPVLEADGSDILCYLESMDAEEGIEDYKAKVIYEEVDKLTPKTTVIFVE